MAFLIKSLSYIIKTIIVVHSLVMWGWESACSHCACVCQRERASESERLLNKYPSVCLTHDAASRDTLTGKVTPKMDTAPPSEHQFCLQKRK